MAERFVVIEQFNSTPQKVWIFEEYLPAFDFAVDKNCNKDSEEFSYYVHKETEVKQNAQNSL